MGRYSYTNHGAIDPGGVDGREVPCQGVAGWCRVLWLKVWSRDLCLHSKVVGQLQSYGYVYGVQRFASREKWNDSI